MTSPINDFPIPKPKRENQQETLRRQRKSTEKSVDQPTPAVTSTTSIRSGTFLSTHRASLTQFANATLTWCKRLLQWLFVILRFILSTLLSGSLPFLLASFILVSGFYFNIWPITHQIGTVSIMNFVPSFIGGIAFRMWCTNIGMGCPPPVITEEEFTEVMAPQFEVAVDLFDHLVQVEKLHQTANFKKRYNIALADFR